MKLAQPALQIIFLQIAIQFYREKISVQLQLIISNNDNIIIYLLLFVLQISDNTMAIVLYEQYRDYFKILDKMILYYKLVRHVILLHCT